MMKKDRVLVGSKNSICYGGREQSWASMCLRIPDSNEHLIAKSECRAATVITETGDLNPVICPSGDSHANDIALITCSPLAVDVFKVKVI